MISLDAKPESKVSSPIGLSLGKETQDEPTISFSELLRGVKDSKDGKNIQNGAFVLSLDAKEEVKTIKLGSDKLSADKEALLSLLKGDEKPLEVLQLNPKAIQTLSAKELKTLVQDAKQFLKNKIIQSDGFKRAEVQELPKTLKGLAQMAKSFGVNLSKITIEEVRGSAQITNVKAPLVQTKVDKSEVVTDEKVATAVKETKKADVDAEDVVEIKTKTIKTKTTKAQLDQASTQDTKENILVHDKKVDLIKEVKGTPLFKAQEKHELTTEQIVQTKQFKVEDKTPKSKADETLKLLLRGEKPSTIKMTADFSVATARVIAPSATTEVQKSFEQLLHGAPEEGTSKLDGVSTHKTDSFEVKLNEAKQMIKYLSQDVKTAIEDYKAPFTRVKVQLNPQKMGEVDVTIVQRGKNLLVNISSNTAAINTLALNANDLKTQLSSNGINNASLNFNNSEQNSQEQASQQQRNRQNERQADEEYNYFANEEQNEEVISSLEIVVPNYA